MAEDTIKDAENTPLPQEVKETEQPEVEGTLRPQPIAGTQRPNTTNTQAPIIDKRQRPNFVGGTQRPMSPAQPQTEGTRRPGVSTQRPANQPNNGAPQPPGTQRPPINNRISLRPGGRISMRPGAVPSSRITSDNIDETLKPTPSMRPVSSQRNETATGRARAATPNYHIPVTDEVFTFEGRSYKREELLSSTTGEAEIFLVSHEGEKFVLKLYYQGYYPSTEVLEVLKNNIGNGYVVDIITYGAWTSQGGEERFGVLMHYYSGGVLKGGEFRGKTKALENVAIQATEAIHFCHQNGIMHKDIKPNNFIYVNESRKHIILADFGIASSFTRDIKGKVIPFVNINQNRTYIYASPEIFNQTVQRSDGKVEVEYQDIKSDYFALGMTLLVLWMGEAPFALLDERSLLKLKRGERSGLPYPEDIPHHTRNLIKGLTIADPKKRWGYEEVQRWIKGEDVDVETTLTTSSKAMRILYSSKKNQIATSIRQLAEFMLEDPALGEQYLYSGKISKWMVEAGFPEWQMRIDSIVNKQYPKSRRSGLLAACYKMNPDLPFVGIKGDRCYNNLQIARELTRNADEYSMALREWDAPLYVYFQAHSVDTGTKFQAQFKSNPWLALWRFAYTISPECEFPFWSTSRSAIVWCNTIDELITEYASTSQDRYASFNVRTPIGKYTPMLLTDECFVLWLAARDQGQAERIKEVLAQEKNHGPELYSYIFFLLDPTRNFFYEADKTNYYTLQHMGNLLNQDLLDYLVIGRHDNNQHFYNEQHRRSEQLAHFQDTKLYYYIKSRNDEADADQIFEYITQAYDLHSKEIRAKAGPYNPKVAILKICHKWAGQTFYYFPVSQITVSSVQELADVPIGELQEELQKGFLLEWLAVQYQENPNIEITDDEEYNKLLMQFMNQIATIDPNYNEVQIFNKCRQEVEENASYLREWINKTVNLKRILAAFATCVGIMIIIMLALGVRSVPNYDPFSYNWRTMAYIALPLFVLMMIPPIQNFINRITKGFLGSPLLFAIVVSNVIVLGWELIRMYIMPYSYVTLPIIYTLFGGAIVYSLIYKRSLKKHKYASCINPDFHTAYVEPLVFAWRDSADPYREFDSSVIKETKLYITYIKELYSKLMSSVKFYAVWLVLLFVGFCIVSAPISSAINHIMHGKESAKENIIEQYDADDIMLYICDVDNALSVRTSASSKAEVIGTLNDGDLVEVVGFEGNYAKILFNNRTAYVLSKYIKPLD